MAKGVEAGSRGREGAAEKASRFFRNINAIGAVALVGAAVVAPPVAATALTVWAGINAAQAGGFEVARRWSKKRRERKRK
jgi:hypothetical protein